MRSVFDRGRPGSESQAYNTGPKPTPPHPCPNQENQASALGPPQPCRKAKDSTICSGTARLPRPKECLRKGLGTWAHWVLETEWVSEIEDVAEAQGHRRETWGGRASGFYKAAAPLHSASPREQVPGTELLCRLDYLAPM